jgi:hypothetical protein
MGGAGEAHVLYNVREKTQRNTRLGKRRVHYLLFVDQLRPQLDNVLQCLSLNVYSIFSLIDDILTCRDWEDDSLIRAGR